MFNLWPRFKKEEEPNSQDVFKKKKTIEMVGTFICLCPICKIQGEMKFLLDRKNLSCKIWVECAQCGFQSAAFEDSVNAILDWNKKTTENLN